LAQHSAERLAKGNAKFFNLVVGDKVLLKDNFRSSNVFTKADWTPVKVTEFFPSYDGTVRTHGAEGEPRRVDADDGQVGNRRIGSSRTVQEVPRPADHQPPQRRQRRERRGEEPDNSGP
jgi:hypothetical protein